MADNSPRALVCLSEGGSKPFRVELAGNKDMIDLKDLIKEKRHVRVLAKDLTLWKVRMTLIVFRSNIMDDTNLAYGGYPYHPIRDSSRAR